MKKKILVLQFRTDQSLKHERDCIIKSGNFNKNDLHFINVLNSKSKLPKAKDLSDYIGIITGGSGQVDISCWSKNIEAKIMKIKPLIKKAINNDMPMLNICFGHQLVAHFLSGVIKADSKQAETGTYKVFLNNNGKSCPIFKGIPKSFFATLGHKDSVMKLPNEAKLLAQSDRCGIQSYQIKNNIFCVQFHPELNKDGMKYRLKLFPSYAKEGNVDKILNKYKETPFATKLVKNFKELYM